MSTADLAPDRQLMDWLLTGRWEFAHPRDILAGITPQDACHLPDGIPYSIAGIVAHMHWWQQELISMASGGELSDFEPRVDDWPAVAPEKWDTLVSDFLAGFADLLDVTEDDEAMRRLILEDIPVGRMMLIHPTHNAYHLGQIVLIRRLQGTWPSADES